MSEHDVMGPVDFVLLEFQSDQLDGSAGAAMLDLVDRGIVSILDLLVIQKEADGSFTGIEITDLTADDLGGIAVFAGARSGLLGDDDLAEAAQALEPGTTGAVIVYENTWARPFVAAAQRAGAQLVASARIPADVVNEVLDALEATTD
jgi:dihydrodipicolinate synthase/N-acetylneuraminate lyase